MLDYFFFIRRGTQKRTHTNIRPRLAVYTINFTILHWSLIDDELRNCCAGLLSSRPYYAFSIEDRATPDACFIPLVFCSLFLYGFCLFHTCKVAVVFFFLFSERHSTYVSAIRAINISTTMHTIDSMWSVFLGIVYLNCKFCLIRVSTLAASPLSVATITLIAICLCCAMCLMWMRMVMLGPIDAERATLVAGNESTCMVCTWNSSSAV